MSKSLADQLATSALSGANAGFIEDLYELFLKDATSVDPTWAAYFTGLKGDTTKEVAHGEVRERLLARQHAPAVSRASASADVASAKQGAVSRLIQVYANRGHLIARLDPLGLQDRGKPYVLNLDHFDLSDADLDTEFFTGSRIEAIRTRSKLKDILATLKFIYCDTIGAEFAHVSDSDERLWLQDHFQSARMQRRFTIDEKKNILWQLTAAEGLERYLHTKYVGQKRFSLEGGDSLIPLLDDLVQQGGKAGVEETIIGMAHRGRLNVLVNLLGKSPKDLFNEFEGHYDLAKLRGSGDVKYHKGFSSDLKTASGNVHVALAFNPSHLEIVNAVVEGSARARQERRSDALGNKVLPVQIHGDAAFAGQGVIMETLQLSQARGFYTGGSIHVIVNNQVGFTTSDPKDARSTLYCSDVAKMVEAPILHVNADDPEAVCFVMRFALEYRMKFHKDIVIDLVCYRRHGHNEADEPAATQPLMYQVIRKKPTVRQLYAERLVAEGVISASEAAEMMDQYRKGLDEGKPQARAALGLIGNKYTVDWSEYLGADWSEPVRTAVDMGRLKALGKAITTYPTDWNLHPRVLAIMQTRERMVTGDLPLDWGCAENLAYASLIQEGYPVRLTGQDSGRGTFFHRHAVLHDQASGRRYVPLQHLATNQPTFTVTDSVLSEEAVMGFEYGFSTTEPHCLTIWEGQFGDFCNGAQVIIDQFISSGEAKWGRLSGLTLFLPHGYEGQGPEHSSARLERFLQLCAEYNIQVCVPSTPAQMFHLLRRQMVRPLRKPLIIMTPKSLLRHALSVSRLEELATGMFRNVIDEIDDIKPSGVSRIVLCTGKVYFDLLKSRRDSKAENVVIVRLEQLYPFPSEEYEAVIRKYANAREIVWCQEEPQNQGSWYQIRHRLQLPLGQKHELLYAGRAGAAAPATGIAALHDQQQKNLVDLETDKVVLEVPAPMAGILTEIRLGNGTTVTSGQVLALIDDAGAAATGVPGASAPAIMSVSNGAATSAQEAVKAETGAAGKLSPAAKRVVEENKVNPKSVSGSGRDGRVSKSDVVNYLSAKDGATPAPAVPEPAAATAAPAAASAVAAATSSARAARAEQHVPMTRLRARIAERMVQAQATQALLTSFNEVDLKAVNDLRARYKDLFDKQHGVKLGFMSFFTKACVEALKKFPAVNASVEGNDIVYHEYFDVGVAVSTDRGLIVPVLRDADQMSFAGIEKAIATFAGRARAGTITIEELTGGTFTITNGGTFGSLLSTPIVNSPQSAILGMHKIQDRPVVVDGQVVVRPMMYIALTYDHRIIDGREAVQFLVTVKQCLEDPARMVLSI